MNTCEVLFIQSSSCLSLCIPAVDHDALFTEGKKHRLHLLYKLLQKPPLPSVLCPSDAFQEQRHPSALRLISGSRDGGEIRQGSTNQRNEKTPTMRPGAVTICCTVIYFGCSNTSEMIQTSQSAQYQIRAISLWCCCCNTVAIQHFEVKFESGELVTFVMHHTFKTTDR